MNEGDRTLTPRQIEVARLVERGHTDKEIAAHLRIAYATVRTHLAALYLRYDVSTRTGLVAARRQTHEDTGRDQGRG